MRIAIFILALLLAGAATAQDEPSMLDKVQEVLSKFVPPPQRGEQSPESALSAESPDAERQALWEASTKLKADEPSDTDTSSPTKQDSPHSKTECLDPTQLQPGQVGYLDYYLFKVVDSKSKEAYLEGEQSKGPLCLINVDAEDLEKSQAVVVTGYVLVRGTKTFTTDKGEKQRVRVLKLLDRKESEHADAQRALLESEYPIRSWTSKDGKHKIEARFLKFEGGKVHLANSAGKSIAISPNDLSMADREYYRDLVKKARQAARKSEKEDDKEGNVEEQFLSEQPSR